MMNPAGEKKRNDNDMRPKMLPRLQRVIAAAARRSAPTLSQSIKTACRSFCLAAAAAAVHRAYRCF